MGRIKSSGKVKHSHVTCTLEARKMLDAHVKELGEYSFEVLSELIVEAITARKK